MRDNSSMKKIERLLWFAAVAVLLFLVIGLRAGWSRDRAEWRATVQAAAASPLVIVKSAPDGTIELWRGLPDTAPSRLVSEIEPRDGVIYSDLRDALAGRE